MYLHIYVCMYTHMWMCVYVNTFEWMCVHIYIYIWMCVYIHTAIHRNKLQQAAVGCIFVTSQIFHTYIRDVCVESLTTVFVTKLLVTSFTYVRHDLFIYRT